MEIVITGNSQGTVRIKLFTRITHGWMYVSYSLTPNRYSIRVQFHFLNQRNNDTMSLVLANSKPWHKCVWWVRRVPINLSWNVTLSETWNLHRMKLSLAQAEAQALFAKVMHHHLKQLELFLHIHLHKHKLGPWFPGRAKFLDNSFLSPRYKHGSPEEILRKTLRWGISVLSGYFLGPIALPSEIFTKKAGQEQQKAYKYIVGKCPRMLWMEGRWGLLCLEPLKSLPSKDFFFTNWESYKVMKSSNSFEGLYKAGLPETVFWKTRNISWKQRCKREVIQTTDLRCWMNLAHAFWALREPHILLTLVSMRNVTLTLHWKRISEQSREMPSKFNETL